jgi:Putative beta-barrel porin 2
MERARQSGGGLTTIPKNRLVSGGLRPTAARLICVLAMLAATVVAARAQAPVLTRPQGPAVPSPQVFYAPVESLEATIGRASGDPRPQSADGALQFADWLLYGGLGWGAACDYNLNQSPTNQTQACGPRFTPSVVAEHNTGIQRTLLYGIGDVRWYPSINRVDVVNTTAGVVHVWEIQRDLIFRIQAQGTRSQEYSGFAANLLPTNLFVTSPVNYTQGYGSTSIQKEFGSFFAAIGGSSTGTAYQDIQDNLGNTIDEHQRNGTVSTLNGRLGYYVSPITYTYIEPTLNWQRYNASHLNSEGYRLVAGIGSSRISLFSGEIYGGYASQRFEDPTVGTTTIPVLGGRLSWFPTRFLTFTLNGDRTFGTSDFNTNRLGGLTPALITNILPGLQPGSVTTTTTVQLGAQWAFSEKFSFNGSVGDQLQDYLTTSRRDNLLSMTGGVTYTIWPGFGINATYTHQHLYSDIQGASFTRDFISVGGSSRF